MIATALPLRVSIGADTGRVAWLLAHLLVYVIGQAQPCLCHDQEGRFGPWVLDYLRQRGALDCGCAVAIASRRMPHRPPDLFDDHPLSLISWLVFRSRNVDACRLPDAEPSRGTFAHVFGGAVAARRGSQYRLYADRYGPGRASGGW